MTIDAPTPGKVDQAPRVAVPPDQPSPPTSTPGATRRAIIEMLAGSRAPMTIHEIERAVGHVRPATVRDSIEEDVEGLLNEGLLMSGGDVRGFQLTPRGQRFAAGIEALAAG